MASPIYTRRFLAVALNQSADVAVWGVPADGVHVLRDVIYNNAAATEARFQLSYDDQGVRYILLNDSHVPPNQSLHLDVRQVIPAGALVYAYQSAGPGSLLLTGYHFAS